MQHLDLGGDGSHTGAAGGLGKAFVVALRAKKANLALIDLDAQATADQAERLGGKRVAVGGRQRCLTFAASKRRWPAQSSTSDASTS